VGGRNGGEMEKSSLEMKTKGKKSRAVKRPRKNSGEAAKAGEKSKEKAAKKPEKDKKKSTKKIRKEEYKGARKALRHAVQKEVKARSGSIATTLVDKTASGDMRSTAIVMELMEKKKKDGERDTEPEGPSLAEQLAGPSWDELQEAKRIVSERDAKTEA
jgi:hypothetical protein